MLFQSMNLDAHMIRNYPGQQNIRAHTTKVEAFFRHSSPNALRSGSPLHCASLCFSAGFSSASGYDSAAAESFVEGQSSADTAWVTRQKEHLRNCSEMIDDRLPADKQGAFVTACWLHLELADCAKQGLVAAAVAVDAENGKEVAEAVSTMAEGLCLKGIKYPRAVKEQFLTCANSSSLNMKVLIGAGIYYMKLKMGSDDLPDLTAENVTAVADEMAKIDTVTACYATAAGEVGSDGAINYDRMRELIDSARGRPVLKQVAKSLVDYCQNLNPADYAEFSACYFQSQPYACAALKSYGLLLPGGRRGGRRGGDRG